uniref:Putative secreted peptide n=1 Tax=Anopheles braziliensis TaxID=58242 RepID=A0A2M3ZWE8_9DIPT
MLPPANVSFVACSLILSALIQTDPPGTPANITGQHLRWALKYESHKDYLYGHTDTDCTFLHVVYPLMVLPYGLHNVPCGIRRGPAIGLISLQHVKNEDEIRSPFTCSPKLGPRSSGRTGVNLFAGLQKEGAQRELLHRITAKFCPR